MSLGAFPSMKSTQSTSRTISSHRLIMTYAVRPSVVCRPSLVVMLFFVLLKRGMKKGVRNQMRKLVSHVLRLGSLEPSIAKAAAARNSPRELRPFPTFRLLWHWVKIRSFPDFTTFVVVHGGLEVIIGRQAATYAPGSAFAVPKTANAGSFPSCSVPIT